MAHVLGVEGEEDRPVDGHRQRRRHDVVARGGVVGRVQPEEVSVAVIDQIGMQRAELPVPPGISEVVGELFRLDIH